MAEEDSFIPMTTLERIAQVIHRLPTLNKEEVPEEDSCPICLMSFSSIAEGSVQNDGDLEMCGQEVQLRGVTKLEGCGHVFCRVDLIEWIRGRHGTCPACRHTFLDIKPPSDSDYGSSDGEYVPGEDDEEEEEDDGFLDTDGFTDYDDEFDNEMEGPISTGASAESSGFISMVPITDARSRGGRGPRAYYRRNPVEDGEMGYEVDVDAWDLEDADGEDLVLTSEVDMDWDGDAWVEDESMENLGLSDGYGSESLSEGDISMPIAEVEGETTDTSDAAIVYGTDSQSSLPEAGTEASGSRGPSGEKS